MSIRKPKRLDIAELLTGCGLFVATAAFVLWQNAQLTVLWDLSYILENATRMALGQLPYRDFPFPYAPLTFAVQAVIIKLFGRAVIHHYVYAAVTGGLATVLTWRIVLRLLAHSRLNARSVAALFSAPLVFLGTSSVLPIPFYDSDCTLFMLICVWLLLRVEDAGYPPVASFCCGILLAVPPFIKQNTGLAFLLSSVVCVAYVGIRGQRKVWPLLAGAVAGVAWALGVLQLTVGLGNYYHWTIQFAASRRLPGLSTMLGTYRDVALIWMYAVVAVAFVLFTWRRAKRVALWAAGVLLALPFLWALAELVIEQDPADRVEGMLHLWPPLLLASLAAVLIRLPRAKTFAEVCPLILLGAIHGAFLSQQLWGSTYALWPLLMILLATTLAAFADRADEAESRVPLTAFCALASAALVVVGGYYSVSHERLSYVELSGEKLEHSKLPALRGVAMRGSWLPDFEELVAYSQREIPRGDAILTLPGEDLFYFTTGRVPQFPVVMMDNTVNPYSAAELVAMARQRNVQWLIVKRSLQLQEDPTPFKPEFLRLAGEMFEPVESLNNYDIYRRKADILRMRSSTPGAARPL